MNNKVVLKIVVICAAVFLVFGILSAIFAVGTFTSADGKDRYLSIGRGEPFEYHKNETIDLDGVTQININTVSSDVVFYESDKELEVTLDCYGFSSAETITLEVKTIGSVVDVNIKYPKTFWGSLNITESQLQIGIPVGYDANVRVHGVSSEIKMDQIENSFTELDLDTVSGNADVSFTQVDSLEFDSVSGDLVVIQTVLGNVNAHTTSGDMEIKNISSQNSSVRVDTVSGNVTIVYDALCETKINTTSGDVTLTIPSDSIIDLDYDSVSGDLRGNYNKNSDGVYVYVDTVSGNLNID